MAANPRHTEAERARFAAIQIGAYIGVPLVKDGTLVAGLTAHAAAPREWTLAEVALVEQVAEMTWAAVEWARVEGALRRSEEWFRLMCDNAPVLIWMSGTDKRCTWFNKPWLDFVGRPMEQELGSDWSQNIHADDYDGCLKTYTSAFDARRRFSMEYRLKRRDGEYRWLLDNGTATRTDAEPDLALDVSALGSAYLGAVSFRALHAAMRVEELREGAVERADAMFAWRPLPWCPEIF